MNYSTLQAFFDDIMNLDVSQGFLSKTCTRKLSSALQPAYAEVGEFIRNAPVVGTDETGHKNPAYKSAWTWCQQMPSTPPTATRHIPNSSLQICEGIHLYTLLQILSLSLFEKMPILQTFSQTDYSIQNNQNDKQRSLLNL